jgi:saccharopine dehydrogenase-like NADP-dependent oxidoreductase
LEGVRYEAFNTSGGVGTLCETLENRLRELNYRTIRYPGHHALMRFLLHDLRLAARRELLRDILERAIPITFQDLVVVFCTVTGWQDGQFVQTSDARKFYRQAIEGCPSSAIQWTTACGLCAAVDLHRTGRLGGSGLVRQEDVDFKDFIRNRFGSFFQKYAVTGIGPVVTETEGERHVSSPAPGSGPAERTD